MEHIFPHMVHVSSSSGWLSALYRLAFSGSIAKLNIPSQSKFCLAVDMALSHSSAPGIPFAKSPA